MLVQVSVKAANALADPVQHAHLFPDLDVALKVEELFKTNRDKAAVPAHK